MSETATEETEKDKGSSLQGRFPDMEWVCIFRKISRQSAEKDMESRSRHFPGLEYRVVDFSADCGCRSCMSLRAAPDVSTSSLG